MSDVSQSSVALEGLQVRNVLTNVKDSRPACAWEALLVPRRHRFANANANANANAPVVDEKKLVFLERLG